MTIAYVDASALVKLAIPEAETAVLRHALGGWDRHVSSAIARVEVIRACTRVDERARPAAVRVVEAVDLLAADERVLERAADLEPRGLRSLDAIHLASALELGPALDAFVAYGERLIDAAHGAGLPVVSPRA